MADRRHHVRPGLAAMSLALAALAGAGARADRIILRGGGQIKGVVLPGDRKSPQVAVLTESLASPLKYQKDQILEVIREATPLREYLTRRDAAPKSAEALHELGLWCEEQKLSALAEVHYKQAVEIDPSYGPAHLKLGHVLHGDTWLTADQQREAQGLVRHKGKWITREELAKQVAREGAAADRRSWSRRLQVLDKALFSESAPRRKEAEDQLMAIRDPSAVPALVKQLGRDADPVRALLARVLGAIPGTEASNALVARILDEGVPDVREVTMEELARREENEVVPGLLRGLRSRDLAVVNRAAWALGRLKVTSAIPKLIPVLVVEQQQMVWVPGDGGGGTGAAIGASFTSVAPTHPGGMAGGGSSIGYGNGVGSFGNVNIPIGVLTPPAVAPGAIAFGGTSFTVPNIDGTGVPMAAAPPARGPQPAILRNVIHNAEVLRTLEDLSGEHFGFNVDAWKRWLRTSYRPERTPARRVPQP